MNPLNNAIIIFDSKLNRFVDKCDDIQSIKGNGALLDVTFSSGKTFSYSRQKVRWITSPREIHLGDKMVFVNGSFVFSVKKVLQFEDWFKVFYENGKHGSYHGSEIEIKRTLENEPLVSSALAYLKRVAEYLKSEDDGGDFLASQLAKMRPVEGCALARFLQRSAVKKSQNRTSLVFPFGSNYSQMQAVKQAFTSDLSVIQGPPGTGKTQTILNIVANALLQGKTVAVVSGNNEATRNVAEKMDKEGLSFLTAFLGNKDNVERFFSTQPCISPKATEWKRLPLTNWQQMNDINARLEQALLFQIQLPRLKKQIVELRIEKALSDAEYSGHSSQPHEKTVQRCKTSQEALRVSALLEVVAQRERIGFFAKLGFCFKHGLKITKDLLAVLGDTIDHLQNKYYALKLAELEAELAHKELTVAGSGIEQLKSHSTTLGRNALLKAIGEKCGTDIQDNSEVGQRNYRARMQDFTKRFPIVFSTTNALQSCTGEGFLYDYLIIDEASQVNIVTACIAFACTRNVVLVGDKMQLPHVVRTDDIQPLRGIFAGYSLPKEIEYSRHSILDAVTEMYGNSVPNTLLNEHYRCDPQIIGFCNKRFYDDSLIVQTTHKGDDCGVKLITTEAHHASNRTNIRQAEIIDREILPELDGLASRHSAPKRFTVGIVVPYRNQVELLKSRFGSMDILIDTVHQFQGKEKTAIIMSTVSDRIQTFEDDERVDFLNNPNLINVAISRAQDILYIIASTELLEQEGSLLHDLAKYNEYYCGRAKRHTKVYSVFDLMFDEYSSVLQALKSRLKAISRFDSENIIATVIDDICKSKKFGLLKFHHNYQLRKVLCLDSITDADDLKFVRNPNTHCDFILFDLLNKEIRLVIEVDGRQHNEPVQRARDERKDRLLTVAGIKVLRLPTTAIECREQIEEALR
jgi:very-short-patch-repair endonuclease/RecA/RadA recombinase